MITVNRFKTNTQTFLSTANNEVDGPTSLKKKNILCWSRKLILVFESI